MYDDQSSRPDIIRQNNPSSRRRDFREVAGILLFCLAFVGLVAVLPILWITNRPFDPDEEWGTEAEALAFAQRVLAEHLGRQVSWQPTAVMQLPDRALDQSKRLWHVTGDITAAGENVDQFRVSVCKTSYGWSRIRLEKNGRQLFYDDRLLVPPGFEFFDDGSAGSFNR